MIDPPRSGSLRPFLSGTLFKINDMNTIHATLFLIAVAFVGCTQKPDLPEGTPPLYPLTGTVVYDGQPLTDAVVVFNPTQGEVAGSAMTDAEGKFRARAYPPHDGLPEGPYIVTVSKTKDIPLPADKYGQTGSRTEDVIPAKYKNAKTSQLTVDVAPEYDNDVTLELQAK
ncbi:hypothetical protein DSM3645_10682 [Blastopirellula marina DSM 3645]|uniref:Carboxypeptidase regulatory-like domain-containing protein n=2 Tax=Blastopirellula marina TaxID=124 RepID=A3ZSN2_9BACT|nr:hypothetical protein DSM3645_10682 [Blastopirellula marina DSM 3645]